nr:porin [Gammaproteobacteria bacterium]
VGADFKYTDNFKSFVYYTAYSADEDVIDNDYAGVGMELKF